METKVEVTKAALVKLLAALTGPGHMIRELQVCRNLPGFDNPIDVLINDLATAENPSESE